MDKRTESRPGPGMQPILNTLDSPYTHLMFTRSPGWKCEGLGGKPQQGCNGAYDRLVAALEYYQRLNNTPRKEPCDRWLAAYAQREMERIRADLTSQMQSGPRLVVEIEGPGLYSRAYYRLLTLGASPDEPLTRELKEMGDGV